MQKQVLLSAGGVHVACRHAEGGGGLTGSSGGCPLGTASSCTQTLCLCVVTKRTRGSAHPLPSYGMECGWLVGKELGGWSWLGVLCARGDGGERCPQGSVWQQCSASPGGCGVPSNLTELWFCDVTVLPGGCKALNFSPVPRRNGELGFGAKRLCVLSRMPALVTSVWTSPLSAVLCAWCPAGLSSHQACCCADPGALG